jgi:hypothetical protein
MVDLMNVTQHSQTIRALYAFNFKKMRRLGTSAAHRDPPRC